MNNIDHKKIQGETLENIGRRLGISREAVRVRIQKHGTAEPQAIAKIKLTELSLQKAAYIKEHAVYLAQKKKFTCDPGTHVPIPDVFAQLPMGCKVINLCDRLGIKDLRGIMEYSSAQLSQEYYVGKRTIQLIRSVLASKGHAW